MNAVRSTPVIGFASIAPTVTVADAVTSERQVYLNPPARTLGGTYNARVRSVLLYATCTSFDGKSLVVNTGPPINVHSYVTFATAGNDAHETSGRETSASSESACPRRIVRSSPPSTRAIGVGYARFTNP
eukprot:24566-Pelagococcus_subviridis.AAC.21